MSKIRVVIADDQTLFRQGLTTLLSIQPDIEVVGEAQNGIEALQLIAEHAPDVVLMDVEMPVLDGVAATRRVRQEYPACQVVILTTFDNDDYVFEGLRVGALGYLLKDAPANKLVDAIHMAARGESFLQPSIAAKVVSEFSRLSDLAAQHTQPLTEPLTPRETEILRLIAAGMTNAEIAQRLVITEGTVKNHVTSVLSKLGVEDRLQAALRARDMGIV
jgi:DNA-binding NarL/FixJ family response regulator